MLKLATIAVLAICLSLGLAQPNGEADWDTAGDQTFLDVFFPEGLPEAPGYFGGVATTKYRLHAEISVEPDFDIVLFSLRFDEEHGDNEHRISLGVVESGDSEVGRLELTGHSPVYLEVPGVVSDLGAALHYLPLERRCSVVHVYLWTRVSGSGSVRSGSDLFFALSPEGTLRELGRLEHTEGYGRSGYKYSRGASSTLWVERPEAARLRVVAQTTEASWEMDQVTSRSCRRSTLDLMCSSNAVPEQAACEQEPELSASGVELLREDQFEDDKGDAP